MLWNELITVFFGYYFSKSSASAVLDVSVTHTWVSHTAGALCFDARVHAHVNKKKFHYTLLAAEEEEGDTQTHTLASRVRYLFFLFIFDFILNRFVHTSEKATTTTTTSSTKATFSWRARINRKKGRLQRNYTSTDGWQSGGIVMYLERFIVLFFRLSTLKIEVCGARARQT